MAVKPKDQHPDSRNSGVTIFDVAKDVGVHASTVSRALDPSQRERVKEPTRIRILEAVDRLGYRPDLVARGLRRGRTGTVGVIAANLGSTYMTPIIHGLSEAVAGDGMLPLIAESNDEHDRLVVVIDHMLSRRVDALVVAAARIGDTKILEEASRTIPVVLASRPLDDTDLPQVLHDEELGGRKVAMHLKDLGHTSAIQLMGPQDILNFRRRRSGFSQYWDAHHLEELEAPFESYRPSINDGRRMMLAVIEDHDELPSAIFAHNDILAIGALSVLHEAGIDVPGWVSLVGYNDLPTSKHLTPPLTTIRTKTFDIGFKCGGLVLKLLRGEEVDNVALEPTLVERKSSGAPR